MKATDGVGNLSTATSYGWTVDVVPPPAPALDSVPNNPTSSTTAAFSFHDTEGGVTFQCDLDGGGFAACSSPKSYPAVLGDGIHTLSVLASDAAGNLSTVTSYGWTVDTSVDVTPPPNPLLDSTPGDPSNSVASFTFHDAEVGATFTCRLDGGTYSTCVSPQGYTGLTQGSHTFSVKASDAADNPSGATSFTWNVDTTGPTITIAFPADGAVVAKFQRLTARWTCQDPAGVATCSGKTGFLPTGTVGTKPFTVHATDSVGNQRTRTIHYTVRNACQITPTISVGLHQTVINGTQGADVIRALRPLAYRIDAKGGNDIICMGDGNDRIVTGLGADVVISGRGRDVVSTSVGADYVNGGLAGDAVDGGPGNDLLQGNKGRDVLTGGLGRDLLFGQFGPDVVHGKDGVKANDLVNGGPGNDVCDSDQGDRRVSC